MNYTDWSKYNFLVNCLNRIIRATKPGKLHKTAKIKLSGEHTGPTKIDTKTGKPSLDGRNDFRSSSNGHVVTRGRQVMY